METLKYKTNMKCGGCVSSVAPYLDKEPNVEHWEVDLESGDKVLTVKGKGLSSDRIVSVVKEAGFEARPSGGFFKKIFG